MYSQSIFGPDSARGTYRPHPQETRRILIGCFKVGGPERGLGNSPRVLTFLHMGISLVVLEKLYRIATVVPRTETTTDDDGQLWNVCTCHSPDHLCAIFRYPSLFGL